MCQCVNKRADRAGRVVRTGSTIAFASRDYISRSFVVIRRYADDSIIKKGGKDVRPKRIHFESIFHLLQSNIHYIQPPTRPIISITTNCPNPAVYSPPVNSENLVLPRNSTHCAISAFVRTVQAPSRLLCSSLL